MTDRIYGFDGEYAFLSNFWVEADGKSGEHRFQAAKAESVEEKLWVMSAGTPGESKGRGRRVKMREDWDTYRLWAMLRVIQFKFADPTLAARLLATGDAELIEANTWNDRFWGVDKATGVGQNQLGKTLMHVREELKIAQAQEEPAGR